MKIKFFFPLFFLAGLSAHFSSAQGIPNGDFESWGIDTNGFVNPTGWTSSNSLVHPNLEILPGTARTGNYSANIRVGMDSTGLFVPPDLYCEFMCTNRPLTFSGYYKGHFFSPNDVLYVSVGVFDSVWNPLGGTLSFNFPFGTDVNNWTYFSDSIIYDFPGNPYYIGILIDIDMSPPNSNSSVFIDDLSITYATGVDDPELFHLSDPSLSRDRDGNYLLNLDLSSSKSFALSLFSIDGKKISEKNYSLGSGKHQIPVYTDKLDAGIYFCRLQGRDVNKVFKFVK